MAQLLSRTIGARSLAAPITSHWTRAFGRYTSLDEHSLDALLQRKLDSESNLETEAQLKEAALEYHRTGPAGKLEIRATKPMESPRDLSLAYSPGVAAACLEIAEKPETAADYTARGNLVAVISNGTAVLGLGSIGALGSKPVMEGKAVLFKKFAGIDVFDIEVDETDPEKLVDIIAALEPTFGGVNLEDIKAPECFHVEDKCKERMGIPVFHDDQHGTAIIVSAAIRNALELVEKPMDQVKLVCSGAGAAALACLDMIVAMGIPRSNITVCDVNGVVYKGRQVDMDEKKSGYAQETDARHMEEVIQDADVFLGLSAPGVLTPGMVELMADRPIIMALANPTPEILPSVAKAARPDCIMATGRSDFPNQVNNVLCFPYIFRGALDVGASSINEAMKLACVEAIAGLAKQEADDIVTATYGSTDKPMRFGPEYLIPKPFDPRLITAVAPAVALAAMESGVATRPLKDLEKYRVHLKQFVHQSGFAMRPLFRKAQKDPKRICFTQGEEERVLRAVQIVVDEGIAKPVLIGRPQVVERKIKEIGLRMTPHRDFELVDSDLSEQSMYRRYWQSYHAKMQRKGVSFSRAKDVLRKNPTVIGACMVENGDVDAVICGSVGPDRAHLGHIMDVLGSSLESNTVGSMAALLGGDGRTPHLFVCDPFVNPDPSAEELAEIVSLAANAIRRFGIEPKVALVSHSNFGTVDDASSRKLRRTLEIVRETAPHIEIDGEMRPDAALRPKVRDLALVAGGLQGEANLLVMSSLPEASISMSMIQSITDCAVVGPILLGTGKPGHVLGETFTTRDIVNMTAYAVVEAQDASNQVGL